MLSHSIAQNASVNKTPQPTMPSQSTNHYTRRNGNSRPRGPSAGRSRAAQSRSTAARHLAVLEDKLGLDMLCAVFGVNPQAMQALINERPGAADSTYMPHVRARLDEIGVSPAILDGLAPISDETISILRRKAATAPDPAPLRRANFLRLAQAFGERGDTLARAIEVIPDSIARIAQGQLKLDEERFEHLNPRLMRAGFPNGWLNEADASLTPEYLAGLVLLANRTEEEEEAYEREANAPPINIATPPDTPPDTPSTLPVGVRSTPSEESQPMPASATKRESPTAQAAAPSRSLKGATLGTKFSLPGITLPRGVRGAGRALGGPSVSLVSATPGEAPQRGRPATADGSRNVSEFRTRALDTLLTQARRGAKVTLWRDKLGRSLAYWGNVRRGGVLFRDELANEVTHAMGLPDGWLDNPTFPPATLADWVMAPATPKDAGKPAASTPPAPVPPVPAAPVRATMERTPDVATPSAPVKASLPAQAAPESAPALPKVQAQGTQPLARETPPLAPASTAGQAGREPGQAGPVAQAAAAVMLSLSAQGRFSEQDAMRLLNRLIPTQE